MNVFHHSQPAALDVGPAHALEWALRVLGALSLLAVGAVHLQQYDALYSAIPTIGTLFVLNFRRCSRSEESASRRPRSCSSS